MMNHPTPLFIDEVQKETSILEEIKIAVDRSEERENFLLSGSSKLLLMKGVSEPTIKAWISILERTGIIYLLQPYSSSSLHRSIRSPKICFRDTGLACYLTRWLTSDALRNSAVAGNMFETSVASEILKSYSNEGKEYSFSVFYYRGKDKGTESKIDLIIEENGILYPVEIKMTGNPKAIMAKANLVLDKIKDKQKGVGVILCLVENKTYLRENLVALPIEYI